MKTISVVGRYRGFLEDLFKQEINGYRFLYKEQKKFEVPKRYRRVLLRLFNLRVFNFLGLFTSYKVDDFPSGDYYFSYNRFISNADSSYVIFLENPTALVNYSESKMRSFLTRKRLRKFFDDPKLKKIVCMSKACMEAFPKYYGDLGKNKLTQIYPLVDFDKADTKSKEDNNKPLSFLFVGATFVGKGGLEIAEVIRELNKTDATFTSKAKFTIVTLLSEIPSKYIDFLENQKNVELIDFNLSRNQVSALYNTSDVFILPTRFESFGLVYLEALQSGCAIIGSNYYAIPEIVINDYNGYQIDISKNAWKEDNTLDEKKFERLSRLNRGLYTDKEVISQITENIKDLIKENKLDEFKKNSIYLSENMEFSKNGILSQWGRIFE